MSALPEEFADIGPIPQEDNRYFIRTAQKPYQSLLNKVIMKRKYEGVINNHKAQIQYHENKLKETELRLGIINSQIAFEKEKVKKLIQEVWEDIKETEELEKRRK